MPYIEYVPKKFKDDAQIVIQHARQICEEYAAQGLDLTLRQLYYQFVSRDLIENHQKEYKRLGQIINDARLAGQLDWDFIVDRTRNLLGNRHFADPQDALRDLAEHFRIDRWGKQRTRVEVWIEKDALVGVLESVCPTEDVNYFSCRGFTSQSEMWGAAQRLRYYIEQGQRVHILHLGDHDPSGIDMTRDITERLELFLQADIMRIHGVEHGHAMLTVDRIALNMDQVEEYDPPPNPAKPKDSRYAGYVAEHGESSWELDALEPTVLVGLITGAIESIRDEEQWAEDTEVENRHKATLDTTVALWGEVEELITDDDEDETED